MESTWGVSGAGPLVVGGVVLGAVTGLGLAILIGSRSGPFPDFTLVPLAIIGGTVGAAPGLVLGGLAGLVTHLLGSRPTGIVAAASGLAVGSVTLGVLLLLGHTAAATQDALAAALVLTFVAAAGAGWSRHRT